MQKVQIIKNGIVTNETKFSTTEEANQWVSVETANGSFGVPEHPELDLDGQPTGVIIPSEFSVVITDITTQYEFEQLKISLISKGNSFATNCQNCLSIIGGYNDNRGLTLEQIMQMAASFSQIESALGRRMPKTSKVLISAIVPDGILVTQELKDLLLSELSEY